MDYAKEIEKRLNKLRANVKNQPYVEEPDLLEEVFGQDIDLLELVFGGLI